MEIERDVLDEGDVKLIVAFTDVLLAILERLGDMDDRLDVIYRFITEGIIKIKKEEI